ncbi:DUF397 domain-containing protein [Streptomyces sp. NPDC026206]|uniref:DUF397 domain-containing protein n=1 Tax=Streptomyces sp. NPDC026206 TaxID=3157089 RepID=UPI0033DD9C2F
MNTPHIVNAAWTKSSYSGGNEGNCVEFARNLAVSGIVPVRDSKAPDRPVLIFTPAAWSSFTSALRA